MTGGGGRDAALTWDVPAALEAADAPAAARPAFAVVAAKHLEALVEQLLAAEGLAPDGVACWAPLVRSLALQAVAGLSPTAVAAHGKLDPRHYIKARSGGAGWLPGWLQTKQSHVS